MMVILVALHLIFLLAPNDASPTLSPNGPVYITNGGSLTLTCETDQDVARVRWKRNDVSIIVVTNTTVCSFVKFNIWDTYNYTMTCDRQRMFMIVRYRVNSSDDNSTWSCQMSLPNNTDLGTSIPVRVLMHVPVRSAQLLNGTTLTLTENQSAVLVCETDACRPSASIYWMKDGRNITDSTTSVSAIDVGSDLFVSIGNLTYTGQRGDNRKILTCGAYNDLASTQTSRNLTVIIYYPPEDPPVIDGRTNGSNLTIIENISQILTCRIIGGNPLANLSWICLDHFGLLSTSGETVTSTIVLSVNRSAQDRRCTCRSSHQLDGNKDIFVSLQVHYPPSIEGLINTYNVIEYESLTVKCQVNSNPPPDQISWSPIGDSSVPSTLYLSSVLRNQSGTYICKAHNMMVSTDGTQLNGTTTSQIQVDVLYSPLIEGLTSPYKVIENQPLNVTCKASSNPPPYSISWSPNGEGSVPSWLYFSSLSRNKSGNYSCTAQNSMIQTDGMRRNGTITSRIQVDVLFAPEMSVKVTPSIVEVNSEVRIECSAHGEPSSYKFYDWIHKLGKNEVRRIKGIQANQSTLGIIFPSAIIADMGTYICLADNGITGSDGGIVQSMEAQINLIGVPVAFVSDTAFIGETNMSASIRIPFYSNPSITHLKFFKTWNNVPIANDTDAQIYHTEANISTNFYTTDVVLQGMEAVLHFKSLKESDFSQYTLVLYNIKGTATFIVRLKELAPPSPVEQFYFYKFLGQYMEFYFVPGFNGGYQQTFTIQFKPSGSLDESWKNTSINGLSEMDDTYRLPNGTFLVQVEKLQPGRYIFRIFSVNKKNIRIYSQEVPVYVEAEPHTAANIGPSIAGIAGGIGGGVVVIVVTGVVIWLWRRHNHTKKATDGTACIPISENYETLQAKNNEGTLYQELSNITSCPDTENSFR